MTAVAGRCVVAERFDSAGVQRDQPRLVELGVPDCQDASVQVGVTVLECKSFVNPQSRAGQQPDQGGISPGAQAVGRLERPSRVDQGGDVGLGVDECRPTSVGRPEQPSRRDFGARLRGARYWARVRTTSNRRA